ncbi:MAG: prepilin-type N-terminal cleavage/methylation domain-containing protein [Verrucomicrobiota bacterium]
MNRIERGEGFSIVELLIVIGVIGILTAIGIPMYTKLTEAAEDGVDHRNAQVLSQVSTGADVVGLTFGTGGVQLLDLVNTVNRTVDGATLDKPGHALDGAFFGVPNLTAEEKFGASSFLEMSADGRRLVYKRDGRLIATGNPY